jgi:hypothetical protein
MRVFADLRPMTFLHARIAEDSNQGCEFDIILDLVGEPVQHLKGSLNGGALLVLVVATGRRVGVEAVGQLDGLTVHLLDFFLDQFGVQFEDGSFDPRGVVVIEGTHHTPKIHVGLDLGACSVQLGELYLLAHLEGDDVVVDDLLRLLEVGHPAKQLVDLGIGIILLKRLGEFLELVDFGEEVRDICVQLLDHIAD